jgi:hypothetical protein
MSEAQLDDDADYVDGDNARDRLGPTILPPSSFCYRERRRKETRCLR